MEDQPAISRFFFRSFITIAGNYVLLLTLLFFAFVGVTWLFFDDVFQKWTLADPDAFMDIWNNRPHELWPPALCWAIIGVNILLCIWIGFQTAWMIPFGRIAHGLFLSILCFASFLQISLTQPTIPKWFSVMLLLTTPSAIVGGAKLFTIWHSKRRPPEPESD